MKSFLEYLLKHNPWVQAPYRFIMSGFFRFVGLFVKTQKNLVLMNGHGYRYNDSPKAIFLKMKELGMLDKYEVIWALKEPDKYDILGARKIKMDSWKYFITALSAKYWISCVNIERGLHFKKKNTIYLNTWHGASLNWVGNAVGNRNDFHFEHIDFFCYNGEYEHDFIMRDFNVREEALIPTGYPRNDSLYTVTDETRKRLRERLKVPENKRVILYAPTWRETEDNGRSYKLAPPIHWEKWERLLGDKYVVFLRTHPYTTQLMNVRFNEFVRDFIEYPDVNDLLTAADILISDYSCIQLDYSILGRAQFCYGYDYEAYKAERGFYFDLETVLPNGVITDEDELLSRILHIDDSEEEKKSRKFQEDHMEYGGHASEKCIEYVFG